MNRILRLILCLGVNALSSFAQSVSVEILADQENFLAHEQLELKVRITNFSGQTLTLGQDDDWLTLAVEGKKNYIVSKLASVPVQGEFSLESSTAGTRRVDLAPHFDLSRPGHYTVTATVKIPQWQRTVISKPTAFNIITGTSIWEQEFGIPNRTQQTTGVPEIRKFELLQAHHLKEMKLYLRISDSSGTVFGVFPIGPLVSLSKPEPQLDKFSNLHVLYQVGAKSFSYSVVSPDGLYIAREAYDINQTRPALHSREDGRITVAGGKRRISANDLPPPVSSTQTSDAKPPQP